MNRPQILKYLGSKYYAIDKINEKIQEIKYLHKYIFIDGFMGSGGVLINTPPELKMRKGYEIEENIFKCYNAISKGEFKDFEKFYNNIIEKYGNIGKDKEAYYNCRNDYNKKYFGTNTIEEGYFLLIISRSCINSSFRVGPNGFNQSFGNRGRSLFLTEDEFIFAKTRLESSILYNKDFFKSLELRNEYWLNDKIVFLDPPYLESSYAQYHHSKDTDKKNNFENNLIIFKEYLRESNAKIIFTYTNDNIFEKEGIINSNWNKIQLKEFVNYGKTKANGKVDVMYTNF